MRRRTLFGHPLGIGLIVLQKLVWGLALVGLAALLLGLRAARVTQPFQALFADELAEDPHDLLASVLIGLVASLSLRAETLLAAGALLYAALEAVEVWGLWRDLNWVEILVVVETSALLPYELWELARAPSAFKVASIAINALVVWYLAARYARTRGARRATSVGRTVAQQE